MVSVTIEDNGEGMSPEIIHKIFDPLLHHEEGRRRHWPGAVRKLRNHKRTGGDIKVKSRPAAGSVFEVLIPEKMKGL